MQDWHDAAYFTSDLLVKRTQIDTEWISVGELVRRASGPKIFHSPIMAPAPPGPPGLIQDPVDEIVSIFKNKNGPWKPLNLGRDQAQEYANILNAVGIP